VDGADIALRVLGTFYVFAGYAATRATIMSLILDRAIATIGATKPKRAELLRSYWLLGASALVLAGGLTLMALLDIAVSLFLASAAGQAVYLFALAPRLLDPDDPPDEVGRRQSTNAFIILSRGHGVCRLGTVGWQTPKYMDSASCYVAGGRGRARSVYRIRDQVGQWLPIFRSEVGRFPDLG
jgi:hypothetical protein